MDTGYIYIDRLFVRNLTDGGGFKGTMKDYEGLCNQKSEVLLESLPLSRGEGLKMKQKQNKHQFETFTFASPKAVVIKTKPSSIF